MNGLMNANFLNLCANVVEILSFKAPPSRAVVVALRLVQVTTVVGMEGLFGVFFMCVIVLPVLYFIPGDQHHHMLYICSISFYNFFGLAVTKSLTAVHRTLIDALRTIVVRLADLFIHYVLHEGFGEAWNSEYGIFQVDGFLFLLLGAALYNELLIIPPLMSKPDPSAASQVSSPAQRDADASQSSSEKEPLLRDRSEPNTGVV